MSCIDLRNCPAQLEGKYFYYNNPKAVNYIKITSNGKFHHYYEEANVTLIDSGTWKKSENGYCYLELSNWKNYNELGKEFETFGNGILWINNDFLDISPDGENNMSLKKK